MAVRKEKRERGMNEIPISGFGRAPIKGEGMISDPDEHEWKCG